MSMNASHLVVLVVSLMVFMSSNDNRAIARLYKCKRYAENQCPTWMHYENGSECICGVSRVKQIVKCYNDTWKTYILDGYVMTYSNNAEVVGSALIGWSTSKQFHGQYKYHYYPVHCNQSELNEVCEKFKRSGRLCGKCMDGYSPLVYSFKSHCVNCSDIESKNAVKFVAAAFIPLTLFYLTTVLFKLDANSPSLHCYIFLAQTFASSSSYRFYLIQNNATTVFHLLSILFGIWNLDFFRTLYTNLCFNVGSLTVISLEYAIAFYPFVLILITFVAVELYSRGFRFIVWVWYPFQRFFQRYRSQWNIKSSLIDVIATFLLLVYNKILNTNFDLLRYTDTFDSKGNFLGRYLFYDGTIEYFNNHHRYYGAMAIVFLTIFNILPLLLLLLYPMQWFQWCLNRFKLSYVGLHILIDSFTGCYKDGMEPGTRDCRYFAALFLFLRILYLVAVISGGLSYYVILGFAYAVFIFLFVWCRPYKEKFSKYNTISVILLLVGLAFNITLMARFVGDIFQYQSLVTGAIFYTLVAIPTCYFVGLIAWWIWHHSPLKKQYRLCFRAKPQVSMTTEALFDVAETRTPLLQKYGTIDTSSCKHSSRAAYGGHTA